MTFLINNLTSNNGSTLDMAIRTPSAQMLTATDQVNLIRKQIFKVAATDHLSFTELAGESHSHNK